MDENIWEELEELARQIKEIQSKGGKIFHTMEAVLREDPNARRFEFSYPDWMGFYMAVYAHCKSCLFCKYMTDVYYDHNGPYMMICEKNHDKIILKEACKDFEPEEEDNQ